MDRAWNLDYRKQEQENCADDVGGGRPYRAEMGYLLGGIGQLGEVTTLIRESEKLGFFELGLVAADLAGVPVYAAGFVRDAWWQEASLHERPELSDELLGAYAFLGSKKAREIVVENPGKLLDGCMGLEELYQLYIVRRAGGIESVDQK